MRRPEAGCQNPGGRLYGSVYGGKIRGRPVLPDAVSLAAAGLRPVCRAGDCPQDPLLNPTGPWDFLSGKMNFVHQKVRALPALPGRCLAVTMAQRRLPPPQFK